MNNKLKIKYRFSINRFLYFDVDASCIKRFCRAIKKARNKIIRKGKIPNREWQIGTSDIDSIVLRDGGIIEMYEQVKELENVL